MSEEDAFLDGIAANRADRTRLLVFADWLADRGDPREEFVRLHTRLLDMYGTEPDFTELNAKWVDWTNTAVRPDCIPQPAGALGTRWLDSLCRVCTADDLEPYLRDADFTWWTNVERTEYQGASPYDTVVLYHGLVRDFATSLEFLAGTIAIDIGGNEWFEGVLGQCHPITRGTFWRLWREQRDALSNPPRVPEIASNNRFLGAQYLGGDWALWAIVAVYQHDYYALFWTTTD